MTHLAVLCSAHNRKEKTLTSLKKIFAQEKLPTGVEVAIYVVDDGSSDGTSAAIREHFPKVKLLQGTGELYWCGGMRMAFGEAMKQGFDYYLWLNDDTSLFPDALAKLLNTSTQLGKKSIIVGSIQDPETKQLTYGGVRRLERWRPLKFTTVASEEIPVAVDTMNGNCVLIPQVVVQKVGNLDATFTHAIGDFDYGLRARKLGIEIYIASGYCGYCQRNSPEDKKSPFIVRWQKLLSPHGLPLREWAIFAQRHAGLFWPIFWVSPYLHRLNPLNFYHRGNSD